MPDRIIRDELLESSRWVGLKDNADRLAYLALLLKADALGNFTADPWRLRRLWSDFGITSDQAVAKTLAELADHDLIRLYEHDGTRYLHIPRYRQVLRYTKRTVPRSPWCPTETNQALAPNSPSEHLASAKRSPSAHTRRKEGSERSEVNEGRNAREQPVDKSVDVVAATHALASKLTKNGNTNGWWKTDAGIAAKGAELGLPARNGESYADWKTRLFDAIAKRERA